MNEPDTPTPDTTAARADWAKKTAQRAKAGKLAPAKKKAAIKPPPWLSEAGHAHWKRSLALLEADVPALPIDSDLLGVYCEAMARYTELRDEAAVTPILALTPSGMRPAPVHRMVSEQAALILKLSCALGMAPASRKSMKPPEPERAAVGTLGASKAKGFAT